MRRSILTSGLACALLTVAAGRAQQVGAVHPSGATLFENRCARCHGLNADGEGGLAPSLIGVVGRPAADRKDFTYSTALKAKGGTWSPDMLDHYLADPQAFAPGGEMEVSSPDPAERAAIIAYLTGFKGEPDAAPR